jgi:pectinesterase
LILRARTSLAILAAISPSKENNDIFPLKEDFPSWLPSMDRKLLVALPKDINADVTVAKDGSGKYKTVKEAVASAPDNGKTRYVIYVKKGTYKENVEVGKKKKNVMLVGDGMDSTIITGSLNVVDGSTTFNSATVGKDLPPLSFSLFLLQIKSSPFLIIKSMSMVFFFQLLSHFI